MLSSSAAPAALAGWGVAAALLAILMIQVKRRPFLPAPTESGVPDLVVVADAAAHDPAAVARAVRELGGGIELILSTPEPPEWSAHAFFLNPDHSVRVATVEGVDTIVRDARERRLPVVVLSSVERLDRNYLRAIARLAAESELDVVAIVPAAREGTLVSRASGFAALAAKPLAPPLAPFLRSGVEFLFPDGSHACASSSGAAQQIWRRDRTRRQLVMAPAAAGAAPDVPAIAHSRAEALAIAAWLVVLFVLPLPMLLVTREFSWLIATIVGLWLRLRFEARTMGDVAGALLNPLTIAALAARLAAGRRSSE
jgi:hypothetical protein